MLALNKLCYIHANGDLLFDDLNLAITKHDKIALVGNNGSGKSTLLKIIDGQLKPSGGAVCAPSSYYVPQHFGQYDSLTVAQALGVEEKLNALKAILSGNATENHLTSLSDDWLIEERCHELLWKWQLQCGDLDRSMSTLSGGQKTKVFLAGIAIHQPELVLLDEPSNHLDIAARTMLYEYITNTTDSLIVVSHDRTLLNLMPAVCELNKDGITRYGGNYDFYSEQKEREQHALQETLRSKEKELRKAREIERETLERKQKLDARGRKKQDKAGIPTIMLNTLRNNAEKSTANLRDAHSEKIDQVSREIGQLGGELPGVEKIKLDLDDSALHRGKCLVTAEQINYAYREGFLWSEAISFQLNSGERLAVKGLNGSGKTTLIKILLGQLMPQVGKLERAAMKAVCIDQDYSQIDRTLTVVEQAQRFNADNLPEHELKIRLNRFLFTKHHWDKKCESLSGGEKMRLMLCCLVIANRAPDLIILDEPTNNLDILNTKILINAIANYRGTLIVVSHDQHFLEEIKIEKEIHLAC